jgi:hypothetical protein
VTRVGASSAALVCVCVFAAVSCRATSRPAPPLEDTSPAAPPSARVAAIARRCARIASCAHSHDPPYIRDPAACVEFWLSSDARDSVLGCLSAAGTCDAIGGCLHVPGQEGAARFCEAHPGSMTGCDGTKLVACADDDPSESTLIDCALLGARCLEVKEAGGLSSHACVDRVRCPEAVTRAWCDGNAAILSCSDGEIDRTLCPSGSSCQSHVDGDGEQVAMCEVPGHASCSSPGSRRCEGNRLVACEAHGHFGHERAVECAAGGFVCSVFDGGAACTDGPPRCVPGRPTCDGNGLSFCAAGSRVLVDCDAIGMGTCDADGRGIDAVCRPREGPPPR